MVSRSDYRSNVRAKYNTGGEIWSDEDSWHSWSRSQIREELEIVESEFGVRDGEKKRIVDIGSAGHAYFEAGAERIDIDLAENTLSGRTNAICCCAEALALAGHCADLIVCVGPVINYCSFEETVSEFARIARDGCDLVLHVELSNSWEFFGTPSWRSHVAFVESFYKGKERYWVYSNAFVRRMLERYGFELRRVRYFHFLSSLAYRLVKHPNLTGRLGVCDRLLSRMPWCGAVADSAVYVCRRVAS